MALMFERENTSCVFTKPDALERNMGPKENPRDCISECTNMNLKSDREMDCMSVLFKKDGYCYLRGFRKTADGDEKRGMPECWRAQGDRSYVPLDYLSVPVTES